MTVQNCRGYMSELTVESTVNKGKVCKVYEVACVRLISLATLLFKGIVVLIKRVIHAWIRWCGVIEFQEVHHKEQGEVGRQTGPNDRDVELRGVP